MSRSYRILLLGAALLLPAAAALAAHHEFPKASPAELARGKEIYDRSCALCHNAGVAGAPKLGDKAAWKEHLHGGFKHLLAVAIQGKGAMPARGGNPKLSDAELKAAVLYMVQQSR